MTLQDKDSSVVRPSQPDGSPEPKEVVERVAKAGHNVKKSWSEGWKSDTAPKPQTNYQPQHQPSRRPVTHHKQSLTNSLKRIFYIVGGTIVVIVFLFHWWTTTSISHESISDLQNMSCSKFNGLSQGNQQAVAVRIFNASGAENSSNVNNEMGSASTLLTLQEQCQAMPNDTVGGH